MIITITGHMNSGKDGLAWKLAKNEAVEWIHPYTDRPVPEHIYKEEVDSFNHFVSKEKLDKMIDNLDVLSVATINNHRYVYFKKQIKASYTVLIVDDYELSSIKDNWDDKLYTIRVKSKNEVESERVGEYFFEHEFDEVFDYDTDDVDELEARISYVY